MPDEPDRDDLPPQSQGYAQLQLDAQLCFPLYAATRAVTKKYGDLLREAGLTYPQYLVLLVLWEAEGPLSVTGIGARLRLDSGTLTPLLKRLEAMGYVRRTRDLQDERRVLVSVTEEGARMRERVADVPYRLGAMMGLAPEETEELQRRLAVLLDNLDAPD